RTRGNATLHRSQIDAWVEVDEPLLSYPSPAVGDVERAIGRAVAGVVPDGATVQVGVGAIPQAVLEALGDHRRLALHSLLVDAAVGLVERGAVDGTRGERLADRVQARGGGRRDHAALPGGLGGHGVRSGPATRARCARAGRGVDGRGPSALSGGARAEGYFLVWSIWVKISSF